MALTGPVEVLREAFDTQISNGRSILGVEFEDDYDVSQDLIEKVVHWDRTVRDMLWRSFTEPSPYASYPDEPDEPSFRQGQTYYEDMRRAHLDIKRRLAALRSVRELLELIHETSDARRAEGGRAGPQSSTIFIVHGHADGPKYEVARFLERATNGRPIILHEQAGQGRAIIETLEQYAESAAFAIVLLTADDQGSVMGAEELCGRARQNVVFELGFFIGALGRARVAVMYEDGVELPSDMSGILYTTWDEYGAWKARIGRELREAGFAVDLNDGW